MDRKDTELLLAFAEQTLNDLEDTVDLSNTYRELFILACSILDNCVKLPNNSLWYNYIISLYKEHQERNLS